MPSLLLFSLFLMSVSTANGAEVECADNLQMCFWLPNSKSCAVDFWMTNCRKTCNLCKEPLPNTTPATTGTANTDSTSTVNTARTGTSNTATTGTADTATTGTANTA